MPMKASQFSDAQKTFILKQGADGVLAAEICRKAGISQATYFNWKKKYEGSEFISRDLDLWAYAKGVTLDFSRPGKPTDNAFIEAFNGRLRVEC
jgi:putative transposase